MAKQYSVELENGELVAAEVDGRRYARVEDIPDPYDRVQIETLIVKTRNGDLEKEFAAQVEQMGRTRPLLGRIVSAVFIAVALIVLLISVTSAVGTARLLAREQTAAGRVVEVAARNLTDSDTGEVTRMYYPVVEYAVNGKTLRIWLEEGSSTPQYSVGEAVVIRYDPFSPHEARIQSGASDALMWLTPAVTFVVGVIFLAVTLTMFRLWPGMRRNPPEMDLPFTGQKKRIRGRTG